MRVMVTADWHISVPTFGVIDDKGINSRLKDIEETINQIVDIAKSEQVDAVIHCGDVFHTNRPTCYEQVVFWEFCAKMDLAGVTTRIIIGNHDFNGQIGKGHALKLFQRLPWEHVKIMHKTEWEQIGSDLFCFYPFGAEKPNFDTLDREKWVAAGARIFLVCHSHLEGAVVGAEPYEIKSDSATRFKDLPVDAVLAGHFHKPQTLSKTPLAFYPGSIQAVDFNERLDAKGVVILETSDLSMNAIGLKTRKLYEIVLQNTTVIPPAYEVEFKDAIVKVICEVTEADAHKFDEKALRDQIMSAGAHSIAGIHLKIERELAQRDPEIVMDSDVKSNFKRLMKQRDYGDLQSHIIVAGIEVIEEAQA